MKRFVSAEHTLAIQKWTLLTVMKDDDHSPFGKVKAEETFDYHVVILYQIVDNKPMDIKDAHLSFTHTNLEGETIELGNPY